MEPVIAPTQIKGSSVKTKIIIGAISIILVAGISISVYFYKKTAAPVSPPSVPPKAPTFKPSTTVQNQAQAKAVSLGKPSITWRDDSYPLSLGSKGQNVVDLQQFLGVAPDGYFGYDTLDQLKNITGLDSVQSRSDWDNTIQDIPDTVTPASPYENFAGTKTEIKYPFPQKTKVYAKDKVNVYYNPSNDYLLGYLNKSDTIGYYISPSNVPGWSKVNMTGYFDKDGSFIIKRAALFVLTNSLTDKAV